MLYGVVFDDNCGVVLVFVLGHLLDREVSDLVVGDVDYDLFGCLLFVDVVVCPLEDVHWYFGELIEA